jgi:hypothetical protein
MKKGKHVKRYLTLGSLVVVFSLVFGLAAYAHSVSYTLGESGSLECYPGSTTAESIIVAKAHHRHKVGTVNAYSHNPDDGQWYWSYQAWGGVYVEGYSLYNQSGRSFSTGSSYARCT